MAEPKFVRFDEDPAPFNGHPQYWITNKRAGDILGRIQWYPAWRQYIAQLSESAVWSHDCLDDVAAFIRGLK